MVVDYSEKVPIIFPYKECEIFISGKLEKVLRPLALVGLTSKNIKFDALIDSGSDRTISFLDPFGYELGIGDDLSGEPDEIGGLSGSEPAWPIHIDLFVGNRRLNVPVHWLTRKFDVQKDYPVILGRKIIFDYFDVVFRQKEKLIYFYKR